MKPPPLPQLPYPTKPFKKSVATTRPRVLTDSFRSLISRSISCGAARARTARGTARRRGAGGGGALPP